MNKIESRIEQLKAEYREVIMSLQKFELAYKEADKRRIEIEYAIQELSNLMDGEETNDTESGT